LDRAHIATKQQLVHVSIIACRLVQCQSVV
jgi:hypothetical protein